MDREYMTKINHYCQMHKLTVDYDTVNRTGPSHDPEFTVVVKINSEEYGKGTGKSKKEAKAVAAKETWEMIEEQHGSPSNMAAAELTTSQPTSSPALDKNYVSLLNNFSQRTGQIVDYPNKIRTGDAHAPTYTVSCTISGHLYGRGTGPSLAAARQAAAKEAYEKMETERSNGSCTFSQYSNSSQVPDESDSDKNSICFADSSAELVEKMKDMAVCEKPPPSQKNARSSVLKSKGRLAANFANVRNKEEEKNMSDSNESLPVVDTNRRREENGSPHTVNKTKVEREAEGLATLTHENIVRYHSSWKGEDHMKYSDSSQNSNQKILCIFIQMEFCEQGTLENWIAKTSKDRKYHEMAQDKFLQIVKGVEYIHSEKLIHRDLKPQNIFLSHNKIKIGDFGLVTSVAFETLTENRGTKSYMAPEQTGVKYGKEVDIYALGLIWFEILSAVTYHEKSKVWSSVRTGDFPQDFNNRFPTEASIIKKMLSTDPSGRITISHLLDLVKSVDKEKALRNYSH
ncbi:interferon-induced, double-stranded RNA-activated protein kinase isoform X3 [Vidua macroura]|uniref:interferon-induced, double-stranded RNA-activated protein kinase isoform X3 n=1 Tax=Vidua macroura TaxID=187451 RepID=UPI0023A7D1F8|nr:interferon-induced, double-stranded RNA-activated protein kinase isoform X3 [Vidua macroura]